MREGRAGAKKGGRVRVSVRECADDEDEDDADKDNEDENEPEALETRRETEDEEEDDDDSVRAGEEDDDDDADGLVGDVRRGGDEGGRLANSSAWCCCPALSV